MRAMLLTCSYMTWCVRAVLEMTKSMEPDSDRSGTGWKERQGLVPEEPGVPGSLEATPERPKQVPPLALGRMQSTGTPRTPRRFVFRRSCPEGAQQPLSSSRSSVKGIFGSWKKSADYSALESQVTHQAPQCCSNN